MPTQLELAALYVEATKNNAFIEDCRHVGGDAAAAAAANVVFDFSVIRGVWREADGLYAHTILKGGHYLGRIIRTGVTELLTVSCFDPQSRKQAEMIRTVYTARPDAQWVVCEGGGWSLR